MAFYLSIAFGAFALLVAALMFPDKSLGILSRVYAWAIWPVTALKTSSALMLGDVRRQPSLLVRAATIGFVRLSMVVGAYVLAAAVAGMALEFKAPGMNYLAPPSWALGLLIFPLGLAWFAGWSYDFGSSPPVWPHLVYAMLALQVCVPSRTMFFALYVALIATLCSNVIGCVSGFPHGR